MIALLTGLFCNPKVWEFFWNFLYQCKGPHNPWG